MEEIEIGEYGRTKDGHIEKYVNLEGKSYKLIVKNNKITELRWYVEDLGGIIKHSKNIIDLIEVGDFVNGELVREPVYNGNVWQGVDEGYELFRRAYGDIKSIVTKEQFASMEYRLEV